MAINCVIFKTLTQNNRVMVGIVTAVSCSPIHQVSKPNQKTIRLLAGLGVERDAHAGKTVKHRSSVAKNPTQPNLRQNDRN
jgi:hypothetical protein